MSFLSHPINENKHFLDEHLLLVAENCYNSLIGTGERIQLIGFLSGLFHDIGKVNPYYQELFQIADAEKRIQKSKELQKKYFRGHSWFSTMISKKSIFSGVLTEEEAQIIYIAIAGHHSKIKKISEINNYYKSLLNNKNNSYNNTFNLSIDNSLLFLPTLLNHPKIKKINKDMNIVFDLEKLKQFNENLKINLTNIDNPKKNNTIFLDTNIIFSALLQADRGSFYEIKKEKFSLSFETNKVISKKNKDIELNELRTKFQKEVLENIKELKPLSIIEAPTGIGKTKLFLDILTKSNNEKKYERVFYFSPLLALTDDFEEKLKQVTPKKDLKNILSYNHIFTGSLEDKEKFYEQLEDKTPTSYQKSWYDTETFNSQFIITTMQRFLMTIYSNRQNEKMKLLSFKNSLLILDEVQTLPKWLIPNLIYLLEYLSKKLNITILFVSATVPEEFRQIPIIPYSLELKTKYLNTTPKTIEYNPEINICEEIKNIENSNSNDQKILFMTNTRKKAKKLYETVENKNYIYLTSGIRKKDRKELIQKINKENNIKVISTQVLEAGVDTSFFKIYRELAPLDNIIQILGRLDRENQYKGKSILKIYKIEGNYQHLPYSEFEHKETEKILTEKKILTSPEIYQALLPYYKTINEKKEDNAKLLSIINNSIQSYDFTETWKIVRNKVFPEDERDSVYLPTSEKEWNEMYDFFTSEKGKRNNKKYAEYTATLPKSIYKLKIENYFCENLLENKILLPKKNKLQDIYDKNVGLDKWIETKN